MAIVTTEVILKALVDSNLLSADKVTVVSRKVEEGNDLEDVLLDEKLVDGEAYTRQIAALLELPYVNLKGVSVPRELLTIIPESTAREHMIVAYGQTNNELQVAMHNPNDRQIVEFIRKKVDKAVAVALASRMSIQMGLEQYRESLEAELNEVLQTAGNISVQEGDDLNKVAEDLPIVRTTELILKHAIRQNASDIHLEPTEKRVIVRYRIDGILHRVLTLPREFMVGLVARIKVLSNLKIDEHRLPQDGRFKIETEDYNIAFRVSILPVYDGEKVVMRLLDESGRGYDLDSLGMRAEILEIFRRNISKPHGMILVTGPTGSGKTTTLYAAMKELNKPEVNISTVEDPIEYRMPRINQTQVSPQIGLTFSNGLRSLVRQDPDILMVGEIRDQETASLAVNAALTGHLVLSTLHTNSAAGALPRLLDMKVEAFLLSSTVNLLLAQRLVRKLCSDCRKEVKLDAKMIKNLEQLINLEELAAVLVEEKIINQGSDIKNIKVYQPVGCKSCSDGYKGRLGIYEAIEFTDEIRSIVKSDVSTDQLETAAKEQQQMLSMIQDGLIKVAQGVTTLEEVLRVAKE
ncbi:MAG: GspE/PulE family protein [Candidatus Andersenbacteria bacterium]|nr:GspE/PulE family protein [bacterium]MDZ4225304.1 GspE/PulE family protein [Candidatus Andersenbacteria bacterium]